MRTLIGLLVLGVVARPAFGQEIIRKELEKLQGTWLFESYEEGGKKSPAADLKDKRIFFGAIDAMAVRYFRRDIQLCHTRFDHAEEVGKYPVGDLYCFTDISDLFVILHFGELLKCIDVRDEFDTGECPLQLVEFRKRHRIAVDTDAKSGTETRFGFQFFEKTSGCNRRFPSTDFFFCLLDVPTVGNEMGRVLCDEGNSR